MAAMEVDTLAALSETNPQDAIIAYGKIVKEDVAEGDEDSIKSKENAFLELGKLFVKMKQAEELAGLIEFSKPFLPLVSKAKAARIVKGLVDMFLDMEAGTGREVELCTKCMEWAHTENRQFLRQALEARLIGLYAANERYEEALALESSLVRKLKKLDDKALLVEVQLLESQIYYALSNVPKARAALTSGRTTANGIYCPPRLQAALDLQSGILHAADERDFKTAFSYFYEACEGYDSVESPKAGTALKYMLLAKIMMNSGDEVQGILSGKLALKYAGPDIEAMRSIAKACAKRSVADLQKALKEFSEQTSGDRIVRVHLDSLYDQLLEQNLCKLIEPYSRVQVAHIAKQLIKLPQEKVEHKLSQMILDKKLSGILDQGAGVLTVFDEAAAGETYASAIETIQNMAKVVDALYHKAKKLG